MSAISAIRDRVEQVLADTGNAIWDSDWIDEGIRQALSEYSLVRPLLKATTVLLSADGREVDISSITGLIAVRSVWLPYTAADPEHPPNVRDFRYWRDLGILYFPGDTEPQNGDTARIFYTTVQTISGLDSASTTTIAGEHETILVNGAAGIVAASRALDLTEKVTIDKLSAQQVRAWGLSKLQEFRTALRRVAALDSSPPWVDLPALDRWDE